MSRPRWHFLAAVLAVCLSPSLVFCEDGFQQEGGGKPGDPGIMPPVLFRSSTCPPNRKGLICSGNGICAISFNPQSEEDLVNCKCYDGYTGADCSIRVCPSGTSWADMPYYNDTAHRELQECSNFGYCDRETGECKCREGWTGSACQRVRCPSSSYETLGECSGHGQCLNLDEAAAYEAQLGNRADNFDGTVRLEKGGGRYVRGPKDWDDSLAMQGCLCELGWEGADCSLRSCLVGDDPLTKNQTDEAQLVDCSCFEGVECAGSFRLRFRGQTTRPIPFNGTIHLLKYFLEQIDTISEGGIAVSSLEEPGYGRPLCSSKGESTRVTFLKEHGALPALVPSHNDKSLDIQVAAGGNKSFFFPWVKSVVGTKEEMRCSGRGTCDRRDHFGYGAGVCACASSFGATVFGASDGWSGRPGLVPDCGNFKDERLDPFGPTPAPTPASVGFQYAENGTDRPYGCPITSAMHRKDGKKLLCSGRGHNCSAASDFRCNCTAGYVGPGCEYRDCPSSRSWFQEPDLESGRAHLKGFRCSGGGSCDEREGSCACAQTYDGAACHTLPCPVNNTEECAGLGKCWTLNKLARYALSPMGVKLNVSYHQPWDAFKIKTCNCGRPFAVDSQVMTYPERDRPPLLPTQPERTYRGPYAFASTPGLGYDCSKARCPTGDDVYTTGVNEVQEVRCAATAGSFKIYWRETVSPDIAHDAGADKIREALEEMLTISHVRVTFGEKQAEDAARLGWNESRACGPWGNNSFFVEFQTEFGELPLMEAEVRNKDGSYRLTRDDGNQPGLVEVGRYQKCTKENLECGRQGICNQDTGHCACMPGLMSGGGTNSQGPDSWGTNTLGHRGDCGFRFSDTKAFSEFRYQTSDPGPRVVASVP